MWRRGNEEERRTSAGNPRSIVLFSTYAATCVFIRIGLTWARVCYQLLKWKPCIRLDHVEKSSIYRRQQGIRHCHFIQTWSQTNTKIRTWLQCIWAACSIFSPKRLIERRSVRNRGWTQVENMTSKCCYPTAQANNVVPHRSSNVDVILANKKKSSLSIDTFLSFWAVTLLFLHSFFSSFSILLFHPLFIWFGDW